jgi:[ribosomal protein S18]-alanine N-acetyltransferase
MVGSAQDHPAADIRIEPMRGEDLPQVMAIEVVSFSVPWTEEMFGNELDAETLSNALVARAPGEGGTSRVVGYICVWLISDELHINNLAVHPRWRKRGVARELLRAALQHGRRGGARAAFLEVRASNLPAQHLYREFHFEPVGVRPRYYTHPIEDAVVMCRTGL